MNTKVPHLILASQSPRRKQLLEEAGFLFEICLPDCEEKILPAWSPEECVLNLARQKAQSVVNSLRSSEKLPGRSWESSLVLAADTVVALGKEIFGKPKDFEDAYKMLWNLSRNKHRVITGVCLWSLASKDCLLEYETTYVSMRPLTHEEIQRYILSGESDGKAGAYAIQETADQYVQKLEGNFDNVVGLPIELVKKLIQKWQKT